jgi:hypothetical protein
MENPNSSNAGRVFASVLAGLLGFLASAALIHSVLCRGDKLTRFYAPVRSEKLAIIARDPRLFNVATFGSSHVHDGFDPRAFENAFFGRSNAGQSVNLAVEAGCQTEQREMALEYLKYVKNRGGDHAMLILELPANLNFTPQFLTSPRVVNIYDWSTLNFALKFSDQTIGLVRILGRDQFALRAAGLHYLNLGMLSNLIFKPGLDESMISLQTSSDRRGLDPLTNSEDAGLARMISRRAGKTYPTNEGIPPGDYNLLSDLYSSSEFKHIQFVYIVVPHLETMVKGAIPRYPAEMDGPNGKVPIINLYDSCSLLMRPDYWHDPAHVNESGARELSRILGEKLRALYSPAAL